MAAAAAGARHLCHGGKGFFQIFAAVLPKPFFSTHPAALLAVALGAAAAGLAFTNPGPGEFESFAADRLTQLLSEEICGNDGLPMLMRLMIHDCPGLVAGQHASLGRLALAHTRRRNLGLFSLYSTVIGGQLLFEGFKVPLYHATTVAIAGRFWMVRSGQESSADADR